MVAIQVVLLKSRWKIDLIGEEKADYHLIEGGIAEVYNRKNTSDEKARGRKSHGGHE